jgi:hypothetical protein
VITATLMQGAECNGTSDAGWSYGAGDRIELDIWETRGGCDRQCELDGLKNVARFFVFDERSCRSDDGAGGSLDVDTGCAAEALAAVVKPCKVPGVRHVCRTLERFTPNADGADEALDKARWLLDELKLPDALLSDKRDVKVSLGWNKEGEQVYVGITNNIIRRQGEHRDRFRIEELTEVLLTRGEARAIELALIDSNPHFVNEINSISKKHEYYDDAVAWGNAWLAANGL